MKWSDNDVVVAAVAAVARDDHDVCHRQCDIWMCRRVGLR